MTGEVLKPFQRLLLFLQGILTRFALRMTGEVPDLGTPQTSNGSY